MLPLLQIGPAAVELPGLLLLAGVWIGSLLAERQARRLGLPAERVERMILVALVCGVIAARLGYAAGYPQVYLSRPLGLLALTPFTLAPDVGAAAGLVAAWIYGQRNQLPLWPTLDALAPGMAAFAVCLALAHLASGEAFGSPADVPWAIELWGARRHPTQAYELLAAAAIFLLLLRHQPGRPFQGFGFAVFLALTAGARLVIEAWRGDSVVWFGSLRAAQFVSLAILLGALEVLRRLARSSAPSPEGGGRG
jgi:prolipoprotein diacylglyceryltransferase